MYGHLREGLLFVLASQEETEAEGGDTVLLGHLARTSQAAPRAAPALPSTKLMGKSDSVKHHWESSFVKSAQHFRRPQGPCTLCVSSTSVLRHSNLATCETALATEDANAKERERVKTPVPTMTAEFCHLSRKHIDAERNENQILYCFLVGNGKGFIRPHSKADVSPFP